MNTFLYFAQTTITSASELSSGEAALVMATLGAALLFMIPFFIAGYVVASLCIMSIFKKAGVPGWMAWVPVVNNWKMFEIGGQHGWWALLMFIPIVNIVAAIMFFIAMYHIGIKLGKDGVFILLGIFLPIVWYIWLAVDKSVWNDAASPNAPSRHVADPQAPQVPPAQPPIAPAM